VTPVLFAAVVVAGGIGAGLRYVLDLAVQRLIGAALPWGILAVNLSGALILGILSGAAVGTTGLWVVGVGLLGGYTTFSAVAVTTVLLAEERRASAAVAYAVATFVGSVALAAAGVGVGALLS
jgi:CrcB protein